MGVSVETTYVEKSTRGKSTNAFIKVITDRHVTEYLHLPSMAVKGAEIHEGLWRSGDRITFERERAAKGALMARRAACVSMTRISMSRVD